MNVLVINCGSSSLKYQLINSDTEAVLAKGLCETKNSWQRKWGRHRPISPDLKAEPTTLPWPFCRKWQTVWEKP